MDELAAPRAKAYAIDCLTYAGLAAAFIPLGIVANAAGLGERRGFVLVMSAVPPLLATLLAARQEAETGATIGKRRLGLRVTRFAGGSVGRGRALLRNTIKIAVPWQLGHLVAVGAAFGGFESRDPLTIAATVVTYPLLGAMVAAVLLGEGRGIHDRVARTRVVSTR